MKMSNKVDLVVAALALSRQIASKEKTPVIQTLMKLYGRLYSVINICANQRKFLCFVWHFMLFYYLMPSRRPEFKVDD